MLTPTVIVAERGELWSAAMRTCVRRSRSTIVEPRWVHVPAMSGVPAILAKSPAALVVAEVKRQDGSHAVLQIGGWREAFPDCCIVAALDREQTVADRREIVSALREAGAALVVGSPRRISEVLPLLERHARVVAATRADDPVQWNSNNRLPAAWDAPAFDLPACWSPNELGRIPGR